MIVFAAPPNGILRLLSRRHVLAGLPLLGVPALARTPAIEVAAQAGATAGTLRFGKQVYPCILGRSGIRADKREGDGATPAGVFPLREVRYRPDRMERPKTRLCVIATRMTDGWCDEPSDPAYNKAVTLPYPHSAEKMWRDDHVYDLVAVIGYNDAPAVAGLGSAIFLHVMHEDRNPTSGCIALSLDDLKAVLARCRAGTAIRIGA